MTTDKTLELQIGLPSFSATIAPLGLQIEPSSSHQTVETEASFCRRLRSDSLFGRRLGIVLPLLIEQDLASFQDNKLSISPLNIYHLYEDSYGLAEFLPPYSPYGLQINSDGAIGYPDFKYTFEFYNGPARVFAKHHGPFIKRGKLIYLLPQEHFQILLEIENFNSSSNDAKSDVVNSYQCLARIKELQTATVSFNSYLKPLSIVTANRVFAGVEEVDGRFTLFPYFDNLPIEEIKTTHLKLRKEQPIYDITLENDTRLKVIPSQEALRAIKKISEGRRLNDERLRYFVDDALKTFSQISALDAIDLNSVKELVNVIQKPTEVSYETYSQLQLVAEAPANAEALQPEQSSGYVKEETEPDSTRLPINTAPNDLTGQSIAEEKSSQVTPPEENKEHQTSKSQQANELPSPTAIPSISLPQINTTVLKQEQILSSSSQTPDRPKEIQIETEQEITNKLAGDWLATTKGLVFEKPVALVREFNGQPLELKEYQTGGIAWLQYCLKIALETNKRHGALLADDMGLGKTLQTLTFLAWCIETAMADNFSSNTEHFEPILIVSPIILLPVWEAEIRKFFSSNGAVFSPYLILHQDSLKTFKEKTTDSNNKGTLDIRALRKHKVIITNYNTITNHFDSLSEIPWSIVVADEAQKIKEPNTAITECMKALKKRFALAISGTPVENKLTDLWSIIDFVEPNLLGPLKAFKKLTDPTKVPQEQSIATIKKLLNYDTPATYILRRTKTSSLDGLPKKKSVVRLTPLSEEQIQVHLETMSEYKAQSSEARHLACIGRLVKIYQHIALDSDNFMDIAPDEYLQNSFKLRDCIDLLNEIKRRNEKVLLFARSIPMQLILKTVIEKEFGPVEIINGSASSGVTSNPQRQKIIREFEEGDGFRALILSPDVAGVGLTITGANNVIHYGRWWNPAKEAQATDRVYRLGQKRDVTVYLLLSVTEAFPTFDEKLHMMLASKVKLAADFLVPAGDWAVKERDLLEELVADTTANTSTIKALAPHQIDITKLSKQEYEALAALYWQKQGYKTFLLTSTSGEPIKLVAINRTKIYAISIVTNQELVAQELAEGLTNSIQNFKSQLTSAKLRKSEIKSGICLKERLTKDKKKTLTKDFIVTDFNDLEDFTKINSLSKSDIWREDCNRVKSLKELVNLIE